MLPGQDWYVQEAFRAICQALGRCIRHEADYGTVVLMDSRHCHDGSPGFSHSSLPKWMRHVVRTVSPGNIGRGHNPILGGYEGLRREMSFFFAAAPIHCDAVLKQSKVDFAAAQEREKHDGRKHEFDSKAGSWTPNICASKQSTIPPTSGCCSSESASSRVTQESPAPPPMLSNSCGTTSPLEGCTINDGALSCEQPYLEG